MFRLRYKIILLLILLFTEGNIIAQTNIRINDSLALHADTLDIKVDYPVGVDLKFSMGNYTIIADHERRDTYSRTKERLLGVRQFTDITSTFSFMISDSASNMAAVTIEEKNRVNDYYPNALSEDEEFFFLEKFSTGKSLSLTAHISIAGESNETWTFFSQKAKGNQWRPPVELFLTDGTKTIKIFFVSSDAYFDYAHPLRHLKDLPAFGFEFIHDGKSLCAVQYDSGAANNFDMGPIQTFGCKAWILQDLDPKYKLILAATMSTLLLLHNQYLSVFE